MRRISADIAVVPDARVELPAAELGHRLGVDQMHLVADGGLVARLRHQDAHLGFRIARSGG